MGVQNTLFTIDFDLFPYNSEQHTMLLHSENIYGSVAFHVFVCAVEIRLIYLLIHSLQILLILCVVNTVTVVI